MQLQEAKTFIFRKLEEELPAYFTYHSIDHTLDVYEAADRIAVHEGISEVQKNLLLVACAFHDTGFLIEMKGHEEHSCNIARKYLPEFGFSDDDLLIITGMIMATQLPQNPKNHLEQIICDADLDYLGREDFFITGRLLFQEFLWHNVVNDEKEWDQVQLKFLEQHHYFTPTSISARAGKKETNLQLLKQKIINTNYEEI